MLTQFYLGQANPSGSSPNPQPIFCPHFQQTATKKMSSFFRTHPQTFLSLHPSLLLLCQGSRKSGPFLPTTPLSIVGWISTPPTFIRPTLPCSLLSPLIFICKDIQVFHIKKREISSSTHYSLQALSCPLSPSQ